MKNIFYYLLITLTFLSCKGQEKQKSFIDTKVSIDKIYSSDEYIFKSVALDNLFQTKNSFYIEGESNGGLFTKDFNYSIVSILNKNKNPYKTYVLFFDKTDVLRDTLSIENKDISLDVTFENKNKGIALGSMDLKNSYFKISDLYEIIPYTLKFKKISLETKIIKCQIPINYITDEYVGLEDYFTYGIKDKVISPKLCDSSLIKLLERNQSSPEGVISTIFYKDVKDSLKINIDILDCISKTTTRENSIYMIALENYINKNGYNEYWDSEESSKIEAYIFNTTYPLRKKYWSDKFNEWYGGKPENFLGSGSYWQDNDYYGLPNLESYVYDFRHWGEPL